MGAANQQHATSDTGAPARVLVTGGAGFIGSHLVDHLLASGAQREALTDYFGAAAYAELAALVRRAARARSRGGPRVYILPGIMGSLLVRPRGHGLPIDFGRTST